MKPVREVKIFRNKMERYKLLEMIGEGSFGRVYKGRLRKGSKAVKSAA